MTSLVQIIWKVKCINKMLKINEITAFSLELIIIHLFFSDLYYCNSGDFNKQSRWLMTDCLK